jgi:hypothetical protein
VPQVAAGGRGSSSPLLLLLLLPPPAAAANAKGREPAFPRLQSLLPLLFVAVLLVVDFSEADQGAAAHRRPSLLPMNPRQLLLLLLPLLPRLLLRVVCGGRHQGLGWPVLQRPLLRCLQLPPLADAHGRAPRVLLLLLLLPPRFGSVPRRGLRRSSGARRHSAACTDREMLLLLLLLLLLSPGCSPGRRRDSPGTSWS